MVLVFELECIFNKYNPEDKLSTLILFVVFSSRLISKIIFPVMEYTLALLLSERAVMSTVNSLSTGFG